MRSEIHKQHRLISYLWPVRFESGCEKKKRLESQFLINDTPNMPGTYRAIIIVEPTGRFSSLSRVKAEYAILLYGEVQVKYLVIFCKVYIWLARVSAFLRDHINCRLARLLITGEFPLSFSPLRESRELHSSNCDDHCSESGKTILSPPFPILYCEPRRNYKSVKARVTEIIVGN